MQFSSSVLQNMIHHTLCQECRSLSGYFSAYLEDYVRGYLGELLKLFFQDPVMPSQEPPADAKSEEVDLPPDDTEDTNRSKTLFILL